MNDSMGRYSKVSRRIHGDEKILRLSRPEPNGYDCFMYLLTAKESTNVPGIIQAYDVTLARSLKWSVEGFRKAFEELSREGLAYADWDAGMVWIPNAIKHNEPPNPNVVIGWKDTLADLPDCELKNRAISSFSQWIQRKAKQCANGTGNGWINAWGKGCPNGYRNQDQEQEQDQDQEQERETRAPDSQESQPPFKHPAQRCEESFETECPDELLEYTQEHQKLCQRIGEPLQELWADFRAKRRAKRVKAAMPLGWSADFEGWLRTFARNKRERDQRSPPAPRVNEYPGRNRTATNPGPPPIEFETPPEERERRRAEVRKLKEQTNAARS